MTFRTVVATPVHGAVRDMLSELGPVVINEAYEPWDQATLTEHCRGAQALLAFMTETIDADFVAACSQLRVVAGALKGYNNIDVEACSRAGVLLTIVPDLLTAPTAELTLGLMISVARQMGPGEQYVRSGNFRGWRPRFYGRSINGSTVAVIGAGAVGQSILKMLAGFDCRRLYFDRERMTPDQEHALGCQYAPLNAAREEADFLVLALHLTPETRHMVNSEFLAAMKRGSFLINPARGSLVDEAAVEKALNGEHLGGYAADTFEMEDWSLADRPGDIAPGILTSERTVLTPHIGSAVFDVRQEIELSAAKSIVAVARGEVPDTAVNSPRRIAGEIVEAQA